MKLLHRPITSSNVRTTADYEIETESKCYELGKLRKKLSFPYFDSIRLHVHIRA